MSILFILLQIVSIWEVSSPPKAVPENTPNLHLSQDQGVSWSDFSNGLAKGVTANDVFELVP